MRQAEELLAAGVGNPPDDLAFTTQVGTPIDSSNLSRELRKATNAAGLGRWTPKESGHSNISLLSAAGLPTEEIADAVGHDGIRMISQVYRHRISLVVDSGVEAMEKLFGDGSP